MIAAFLDGEDIHTATAAKVFHTPLEQVTADQRKSAKAVNFGIVYGISAFSLADDLKVSRKEADDYIKSYFATYGGIERYLKETVETAKKEGYVSTMLGRKRFIPELTSGKGMLKKFGERVAMNSPIQGSAADIIKIAMVRVDSALKEADLDARLILQVHDELIVEAAEADAAAAAEILKREMEGAVSLQVPLTVELNRGKSWFDCK
jgi:DNA polymerase-1